jgi:hypothetical protein
MTWVTQTFGSTLLLALVGNEKAHPIEVIRGLFARAKQLQLFLLNRRRIGWRSRQCEFSYLAI